MGVMASMALMPVWRGWPTGWRPMIEGAWISMRRGWAPTIGPLPSMGSPRALTTRPSMASPTGTDRMRPVALTVWPSSMPSTLPSTTAPMEASSRLRARPMVPSSNSSSSLTAAPGQAGDTGDAVTDLGDAPDGAGLERRLEALEVLLQRRRDVGGGDRELCHGCLVVLPYLDANGFI